MSDSLKDIVKAWHRSGGKESLWQFLVRTNPWVFAHHPGNEFFREHVWCFHGLYFCKGCVMTVTGWCVAVTFQLGTDWLQSASIGWLAISFIALLIPTVVTSLWGGARIWKHVARVMLGVLMSSSIWLFVVTEQWWVRGVLVAVYFSVKIPLDSRRQRQNKQMLHVHTASVKRSRHRDTPRGSIKGG